MPAHARTRQLLSLMYLADLAALVLCSGIYKSHGLDRGVLAGRSGVLVLLGAAGLFLSIAAVVHRVRRGGPRAMSAAGLALATNLFSLLLTFAALEAGLRLIARRTPAGVSIGSTRLKPSWSEMVEESHAVLDRAKAWDSWDSSFFVFDAELGWTVGSDRQTSDGLYYSSVEGIRSDRPGRSFAGEEHARRVALLGDSNAFSFEVSFEESWAAQLEPLLGDDAQVLNFGVDGYGVDQMCLRYERDVRPWQADVVLIGLIGHDLRRTLAVYPIISFGWPGYVVKPRFALVDGAAKPINLPLPEPEAVLAVPAVHELPNLRYDLGYQNEDWLLRNEKLPYVLRYLGARFPRWPLPDPAVSEAAARRLNVAILKRLVGGVEADGSTALVVLLSELSDELDRSAEELLSDAGIPFLRVDNCLQQVPVESRRVQSGNHFTGLANGAIARCTAPAVREALGDAGER